MRLRIAFAAALVLAGCGPKNQVNPQLSNEMPRKMLWAWERPEDLRFIDPNEFGVAFLAQTIFLEKDRVNPRGRRQPLEVAPGTYLVAVTRIETSKETSARPKLDKEMASKTATLIRSTLDLPDVGGVQVDFDAVVSEREFYRWLMIDLRRLLEQRASETSRVSLTMTSLASWCTGDAWFNDFPVDEAVPMLFRMGADEEKIRNYIRNGNDWREPLCLGSYGLSIDDPSVIGVRPDRRVYYFKDSSWRVADLAR